MSKNCVLKANVEKTGLFHNLLWKSMWIIFLQKSYPHIYPPSFPPSFSLFYIGKIELSTILSFALINRWIKFSTYMWKTPVFLCKPIKIMSKKCKKKFFIKNNIVFHSELRIKNYTLLMQALVFPFF